MVEIDGLPVRRYAEQNVIPYIFASTEQDLMLKAYEQFLLAGPAGRPVELALKDAGGRLLRKSFQRLSYDERAKRAAAAAAPPPAVTVKLLPGNIAHVVVSTFATPRAAEQFEAAFPQFAGADALVVDVRGNNGGDNGVAYKILGMLTDKPFKGSQWYTRDYRPVWRARGQPEELYGALALDKPPHGTSHYARPVVVLTSARTFSAAEDFLVAFRNMKRGLVVGEPTGGSTGQPLMLRLPGGGYLNICAKHDSYADGREFIGLGVQPDRLVRPTVADFLAGRDTVLQAALGELNKTRGR